MKYLFLILILINNVSFADTKILNVGVFVDPPFVYKQDGQYHGIAIDLWEQIAKEHKYDFTYIETDINNSITKIENQSLDITIGSISITDQREQRVDFSSPYYQSGLALITKAKTPSVFTLEFVFRNIILLFWLALFVFIGGTILYWIERKKNEDLDTIEEASWWAIVTVTTTGYGDKVPRTRIGRILAGVFMVCGALVFPTIVTSLGAINAIDYSKEYNFNVNNLKAIPSLGVVKGTVSHQYVIDKNIKNVVLFESLALMVEELKLPKRKSIIVAGLYDKPMLEQIVKHDEEVVLIPGTTMLHFYGFIVETNSDLLENLNRSIPHIISNSKWSAIVDYHFNQ